VFNPHAALRNRTVFGFLLIGKHLAAWFLVRLRNRDTVEGKTNKAEILEQFAPFR